MRRPIATAILTLLVVVSFASAASVDGINIYWTSTGNASQAVIFVHGWNCDETSWQGQVAEISQTYRVVTLDLPGHGKSGSPKGDKFSMDLLARAVEAVRSEAKVEKAVFVGHSMGTPVIRQYALKYPQHVAALVLVDGLVQVAGAAAAFQPPPMTGPEGLKARETMGRGMFGPGRRTLSHDGKAGGIQPAPHHLSC